MENFEYTVRLFRDEDYLRYPEARPFDESGPEICYTGTADIIISGVRGEVGVCLISSDKGWYDTYKTESVAFLVLRAIVEKLALGMEPTVIANYYGLRNEV